MSSTRIIRAPVPSSAQVVTGNQDTARNETRPAPGYSGNVSVQDTTSTALEKSGFESHTGRDVLLNEGTTQTSPTADRTRSGIYRSLRSSSPEAKDPGASADSTSSKTEGRLRGQRALSLLSGGKELLTNESTNDTQGTSEKKQSTPLSSEKKLLAKKKKSMHLAKKMMLPGKKETNTTSKQNSTAKTARGTGASSTQAAQKSENTGTAKSESTTSHKAENTASQKTDTAATQRSGSATQTSSQTEAGATRGVRESTLGTIASQQASSSSAQTASTGSRALQTATAGASVGGNVGTNTGAGTTGSASAAGVGGFAEKQSAAALMLGANGAAADRTGIAGAGNSGGIGGSVGTLTSSNALAHGATLGQATADVSGKLAILGQSLASATSGAGSLRADTPLAQQATPLMAGNMNSAQMSEGANRLLSLQSLLLQGAKEGSETKGAESSKETSSPRQEFREMVKQWANAKEMAVLFNLQATVMPNDVSAVAWKIATLAQQGALPKSELMALLSKLLKTPGNRKKLERIKNLLIKKGLVSAGVSADSLELIAAMIAMYLAKKGDIEADDLLEELFGLPSRNLDLIVPDEGGSFHEEGREEQNHQEHREGLKLEKSKT